jgi:hypothetical protein
MANAEIKKDNLFASLRRLFSTDVIIRNTGSKGGGITVMDTDNIQTTGVIQTNSLIDRFHKVYTTSTAYGINLNLAQNYQSMRVQIYADYDAMDFDAIISSALDIIADECLGGDTIIPLLDGRKKSIKELYEENAKNFWLYGLDQKTKKFKPIKADKIAYNGKKEVYKITFDDGTEIKATDNHIWVKSDSSLVHTKNLKVKDSLLALPTIISDTHKMKGYEMIWDEDRFEYTHRIVGNTLKNLKIQKESIQDSALKVIHHKSFNKRNNDPSQLEWLSWEDHTKIHQCYKPFNEKNGRYDKNSPRLSEELLSIVIKKIKENPHKKILGEIRKDLNIVLFEWRKIIRDLYRRYECNHSKILVNKIISNDEILVGSFRKYCNNTYKLGKRFLISDFCNQQNIKKPILRRIINSIGYKTLEEFAQSTNHKIISIEKCGIEDVYDVVNAGDNHIFAIETNDGSKLYTHNCTLKDESGVLLRITSADENIQNILEQLFYSVLNIEFNLWGWVRNMCKYGDFYLKMEISEGFGVYNVIPFSAYNIVRQEGFNPHNPNEVRFKFDPNAALGSTTGYTSAYNNQDPGIWFDNYEMAHFRFVGDVNYLPYGKSYLENARKLFKQYTLIEDAMLIHRIVRAPDKRAYYVNVGAIPPMEVESYIQKMMNKMKKTPLVDPQTGMYNMKYNEMNMLEDYFIPFRGNGDATRIDTIPGLTYNGIEDVQYFREKVFAALKIPKAFMGYEKDLTGKATLAAEDIRFARTIERIQRIIVSELKKIALVHLYANGYTDESIANFQLSLTGPSIIYEQERLAMLKEKVDLINQASDAATLPRDYIWKNVFHISEDEFTEMEDMIIEDQKRKFRYKQIQEEGNDPAETGQAFGTPHQLASLYGGKGDGTLDVPSGYDELDPNRPTKVPGRPQKYKSTYATDDSPFGRDRLGSYDLKSNAETGEDSFKPKFKGGPLNLESTADTKAIFLRYQGTLKKMFPKTKTTLFESTLDEDNILEDLEK